MIRNSLTLWAVLFCLTTLNAQYKTLSYRQFSGNVRTHHPLAKQALNSVEYGQYQLKAAQGNFDPVLNGSSEQKFFDGTRYFNYVNGNLKLPIFSSQYIKIGYDYGQGSFINPERYTKEAGLPFAGVELNLLQGLSIDKRRAELLKAKAYTGYYEAERKAILNDLLAGSAYVYSDWLLSVRQLAINRLFLALAEQRLNGIKQLTLIGEKAVVDTIEAAVFYQSRLQEFQDATIQVQYSANALAGFNWGTAAMPDTFTAYAPADSLEVFYNAVKLKFASELNQLLQSNPSLEKLVATQQVLAVEQRWRKELIKPNLTFSYNFLSVPGNAPVFSTNGYKWGINLSFPILFRNPRNSYHMAVINTNNNALDIQDKSNEINIKIKTIEQNFNQVNAQILTAERSIVYSKQLVEAEKLKFEVGESSLFLLNMRESKWLENELKLARLQLKFIQLYLQLIHLKGNLNYDII